jgi:hypothetical protein
LFSNRSVTVTSHRAKNSQGSLLAILLSVPGYEVKQDQLLQVNKHDCN